MHLDTGNAAESTIIGTIVGLLWNIYIPLFRYGVIDWFAHTVGACATAAIAAVVVYHVNKILRRKSK